MRSRRGVLIALAAALAGLTGCVSASSASVMPTCSRVDQRIFVLEAQAVPSATQLPCVSELPVGWTYSGFDIQDGFARFWLDNDRAGLRAVEVTLQASCDVTQAVSVDPDPDETSAKVYQEPTHLPPGFSGVRFLVFPGGCITYTYAFAADAPATLTLEAQQALSLIGRGIIVDRVRQEYNLTLCGAEAPPCRG